MIVLLIIIVILLLRIISNQHEIDYHICESTKAEGGTQFDIKDMIIWNGLINRIIWIVHARISDIKYYIEHNKK